MKILETRVRKDGFKYRRREDGSWTVEVPVEVWRRLNNQGRQQNRIEAVLRANALEAKRRQALIDLRDGLTARASAHDLEVSLRTINRWRASGRVVDGRRRSGENPLVRSSAGKPQKGSS